MDAKHNGGRVFLFPWYSYGHISPFFELAMKLIERGFYVYLCNTPVNLELIKKKIAKKSSLSHSIQLQLQLVEYNFPSLSDIPSENHTTHGISLQEKSTFAKAFEESPSLPNILKTLNPDLVIYDSVLQEWMEGEAYVHKIPTVQFHICSTIFGSYCNHISTSQGDTKFPFSTFRLGKVDQANLDRHVGLITKSSTERNANGDDLTTPPIMTLLKTSRALEGKYIDYLNNVMKHIPVGHLVQEPVLVNQDENVELMEWLGRKNKNSTLFVSFGSEMFVPKDEIEEIAAGLELSDVDFIWTIKRNPAEDEKEILPEDFLERIGDKGRVIEGWVPQQYILNHPSIGGFVSHCGWNSTLESIEFGVPIIAMPLYFDNTLNAKLVMESGIGLEVMKDDNGKFHRDEIAQVIKDVIVGNKAEAMRKQVKNLREKVKMSEKEEMDEACQALAQICNKGYS